MPMIDATIPEGALQPEAEARLIKELTDILIAHEGFDVGNQNAQSVSVVFLHRPAAVYVAGSRSPLPRYRIVPTVPEGQYTDAIRKALVKAVTDGGGPRRRRKIRGRRAARLGVPNRDSRWSMGRSRRDPFAARHSGFHRRGRRTPGR